MVSEERIIWDAEQQKEKVLFKPRLMCDILFTKLCLAQHFTQTYITHILFNSHHKVDLFWAKWKDFLLLIWRLIEKWKLVSESSVISKFVCLKCKMNFLSFFIYFFFKDGSPQNQAEKPCFSFTNHMLSITFPYWKTSENLYYQWGSTDLSFHLNACLHLCCACVYAALSVSPGHQRPAPSKDE